MSDDFYKTLMGRRFYEATMPGLVAQLERLNGTLGKTLGKSPGADAKALREAQALDDIAALLERDASSPDGWETITELVRATGRRVRAR